MSKQDKLLARILRGGADTNISFSDLCSLLRKLGFQERIRGSHHIFHRDGIEDMVNLQKEGTLSKNYQVRQVRNVILNYGLDNIDEMED